MRLTGAALDRLDRPWALIGGLAVSALTEPRFTRDVDLATVRLRAPGESAGGVVVDLLFASSGIEAEIVAAARREALFTDVDVPLPALGHLLALKVLSESERRPRDRQDIVALIDAADAAELARAQEAVDLITRRGYNRERDLTAALARWISRVRPR